MWCNKKSGIIGVFMLSISSASLTSISFQNQNIYFFLSQDVYVRYKMCAFNYHVFKKTHVTK